MIMLMMMIAVNVNIKITVRDGKVAVTTYGNDNNYTDNDNNTVSYVRNGNCNKTKQ